MARFSGKNARLYFAIASGGTAEPIPFIKSFSVDRSVDRFDVTAYGDTNKAYTQGLPDSKGSWSGFADDSTAQLYTAAADGISRRAYHYPNISVPGNYSYGFIFVDTSEEVPVDGPAAISGTWASDGTWTKVGF